MPEVLWGVTLVPPRTATDCACDFCGMFRAGHYWVRAVVAVVVAVALWFLPGYVEHEMRKLSTPGEMTVVVGGLYLVATGASVLAFGASLKPFRRALHRLHPRRRSSP